ncbi:MAG: hypothetical protein GXO86_12625 [Chlorobi bacterium]|nr:hypothetical protein [Chlorobiota bacterium]
MSYKEADRALIILSLEVYDMVTRLYEQKGGRGKVKFNIQDLYFLIYTDEKSGEMCLDVDMQNEKYLFRMKRKGWMAIYELKNVLKREHIDMMFDNSMLRFVYDGNREFCMEICSNLINLINSQTVKK